MTDTNDRFWETTPLHRLSRQQWEALCDGCGRCCLQKLENRKTGKVYFTVVACRHLDLGTCRCLAYAARLQTVPGCLRLTPENLFGRWLPSTCAYRRLATGKPLPNWHPLVTGDRASVHRAGISVSHFAISEEGVPEDYLEAYIFGTGKL